MKKLLVFCVSMASFFLGNHLYAQGNYTVIKVYGDIQYQSSRKPMSQGDVFSPSEQLVFKSTESKAAVINPSKGRFLIAPPSNDRLVAQANFIPAMSNVSARAGANNNVVDLQNTFHGNFLILERVKIKVSPSAFPMNDSQFFFIRYKYNGEDINKKLPFRADSFIIDQKEILKVDGKPIPHPDAPEMKLFYLSKGKSTLISEFCPVFPDYEPLKKEVLIILDQFKDAQFDTKVQEVMSYLNEFYGKPNDDNVKYWLKTNFKL